MRIYWSVAMRALRILLAICPLLLAFWAAIPAAAQQKEQFDIMFDEANQLYGSGKLAEALTLAIKTRDFAEKEYGTEDRRFFRALRAVALIHMGLKQFEEAEAAYERLIAKYEQVFGPDDEGLANTINQFGTLRLLQGRNEEAEANYRRALAILDKLAKVEDPPNHAYALDNLSRLLAGQHRYDDAEPLLKRALAIMEKEYPTAETRLTPPLNSLAWFYMIQHKYDEAEPYVMRGLAIAEKTSPPDDANLERWVDRVASLNFNRRRNPDAIRETKRSIALIEKIHGADSIELVRRLKNLAIGYNRTTGVADSEPVYLRIISIIEKAKGPESLDLLEPIEDLASALTSKDDKVATVEALYKRAIEIIVKAKGPDDPDLRERYVALGRFYQYRNPAAEEAETQYKRSVEVIEKTKGPDDPEVAEALETLARFYVYGARDQEAKGVAVYQRMIAILEKAKGPEDFDLVAVLHGLGYAQTSIRNFTEAETSYLRALAIAEKARGPDHHDVIDSLMKLAEYYSSPGIIKPGVLGASSPQIRAKVVDIYRRAIGIAEKAGGEDQSELESLLREFASFCTNHNLHPEATKIRERLLSMVEASKDKDMGPLASATGRLVSAMVSLGDAYSSERRYAESEPIYKRVMEMDPSARDGMRGRLIQIYRDSGRYADAEPIMRQALAEIEQEVADGKKSEYKALHSPLMDLANLLVDMNKPHEAEPIIRRALAMAEQADKNELFVDEVIAKDRLALGNLMFEADQFTEAEELFRQAMQEADQKDLNQKPSAYDSLARLLAATNRPEEAETLFRRALALIEQGPPGNARNLGNVLSHYAGFMQDRLRIDEAIGLHRRSLALAEKTGGVRDTNLDLISPLNNLATALEGKKDYAEAEQLLRRSLRIAETALGPDHPRVATRLSNLGGVLVRDNRAVEAIPLFQRALAIVEKSRPADHTDLTGPLSGLAEAMFNIGRLVEAETLLRRALAINEKAFGRENPETATGYVNIGLVRATTGDWAGAVDLYRRALPTLTGRTGDAKIGSRLGLSKAVLKGQARPLHYLASALYHADPRGSHLDESLQAAQWARQSEAGDALAQMSARLARAEGPLAELVRNRERLVAEREAQDKLLLKAIGRSERKGIDQYRRRIAEIDTALDKVEAELAEKFPDYSELANPKPLTLAEIQSLLGPDEALIAFSDMEKVRTLPGETLVWVVTREAARERSVALDTAALAARVNTLRCGLDLTLWRNEATAKSCASDLAHERNPVPGLLPFDLLRAHDLYKELFAPDEDLIKGKYLLISPSGALTSLPFGVLVTERPRTAVPTGAAEYSQAAWLGTRQPISILPSPNALKALRRVAKASKAAKPYLGIGNPTLVGTATDGARAKAARERQNCATRVETRVVSGADRAAPSFDELLRSAHADIEQIRMASPLPETADELCDVGQRLRVGESDILLGARASETTLKAMSEGGKLADYRFLHFATHGVLAGNIRNAAEPGLLLTPPEKGTNEAAKLERDDGFLTASEIAALNLDSEWVILSACNTAGGAGEKAEALSGMARAFFYAGGRSLLVSHWEVDSEATVKLVTGAFAALSDEPEAPHAEVMRQSMLALVKAGGREAHPAYWAPFVVVGADGRPAERLASADPVTSAGSPAPTATAPATTSDETYITAALAAAAAIAPDDPSPVAADEGGVIVKMPLPVRAPSAKERKAAALKLAKKQKPGFKPNTTSAWEEVFRR
jgi:CHAT domain-containing protein/tetratricopeptide (TPR) repeat protein